MIDRNATRRKLKSRSGFTLAEALVTILIMLMVSSIVTAGIPAAKNAYEKVVLASNAEVLLSTTISTLRNELGTVGNDIKMLNDKGEVKSDGTRGIQYYNSRTGAPSKIWYGTATGHTEDAIWFQRYAVSDESMVSSEVTRLMSEEVSTGGLNPVFSSVSYDPNTRIITFNGLKVKVGSSNRVIAKRGNSEKFSIRVILIDESPGSTGGD